MRLPGAMLLWKQIHRKCLATIVANRRGKCCVACFNSFMMGTNDDCCIIVERGNLVRAKSEAERSRAGPTQIIRPLRIWNYKIVYENMFIEARVWLSADAFGRENQLSQIFHQKITETVWMAIRWTRSAAIDSYSESLFADRGAFLLVHLIGFYGTRARAHPATDNNIHADCCYILRFLVNLSLLVAACGQPRTDKNAINK